MITNIIQKILMFLGLVALIIILVIGGFYLHLKNERNKDVASGKYSISKAINEVNNDVVKVVTTTTFCDYNPEVTNPNCIASEEALIKASEDILKLGALINMFCPEHISENIVDGNLHGLLLFFGYDYMQRNMYSLQMFQPTVYEAITGQMDDLLVFDFKAECPESIEMEGQISSQ